jgi:HAD superfamily phosphatase (TIGR01668 family)
MVVEMEENVLYPKEYFNSVKDISIDLLNKYNIKGLILDVDNTLINLDRKMPEGISEWAKNIKENGIKICILSNSNKIDKVGAVAKILNVPYIFFGKKPLKSGFLRAKDILKLDNENIAVVGDQIFTDIIGANRCNMFSILVKPIEEKDYLITRLKRPIERLIINKYKKNKMRKSLK